VRRVTWVEILEWIGWGLTVFCVASGFALITVEMEVLKQLHIHTGGVGFILVLLAHRLKIKPPKGDS